MTMFASNQGTFDPWYGRFIGPRQLSKVEVDESQAPKTPSKAITPFPQPAGTVKNTGSIPKVNYEKPPFKTANVPVEETNAYIKKNGIYYCKFCDEFCTGSGAVMNAHVADNHQVEVATPPTRHGSMGEAVPAPRPIVEPSAEKETPPVAENKPEIQEVIEVTQELVTDNDFRCEVCGKSFKSSTGLGVHKAKKHPAKA